MPGRRVGRRWDAWVMDKQRRSLAQILREGRKPAETRYDALMRLLKESNEEVEGQLAIARANGDPLVGAAHAAMIALNSASLVSLNEDVRELRGKTEALVSARWVQALEERIERLEERDAMSGHWARDLSRRIDRLELRVDEFVDKFGAIEGVAGEELVDEEVIEVPAEAVPAVKKFCEEYAAWLDGGERKLGDLFVFVHRVRESDVE